MFFIGGAMAMVIRAELFQPGLQFVDPQFFNSMTTVHALVMIFGAVMPAGVGLANWMIPMMIGAPDMAMPRMNNMSFWILPFAFTLLLSTFFMQGGAPAGGWTMYPPLVLQLGDGFPFLIFAVHFLGISSIMGAINIIATVFNMRAPGMTFMRLPLFVWTWIITAFLLIAAMPVLAGAVTMLLTDKFFGTAFFDAAGGGDPSIVPACVLVLLVIRKSIFWCCLRSVLSRRLFQPLHASHCLVMRLWSMRQHQLPFCLSLFGRTICLPLVCLWQASCSSCMPPWRLQFQQGLKSLTGRQPCGKAL